jgi:hypothetical protein
MPGIWESGNHPTVGASRCVFGTPRAALYGTLYSALLEPPSPRGPFMAKVLRSDMHPHCPRQKSQNSGRPARYIPVPR